MSDQRWRRLLFPCLLAAMMLAACTASAKETGRSALLEQAAAEATAIVERAEATAMVLRARAQATAALARAGENTRTPSPAPALLVATAPPEKSDPERESDQGEQTTPESENSESAEVAGPTTSLAATPPPVQVLSVGMAGEGGMIIVRFRAPRREAERWWQGSVSVTDEQSGELYNEIMVMPKLGPLIARPREDGGNGYVMLVNRAPRVSPGDQVTVVLGDYRFEHLAVQ